MKRSPARYELQFQARMLGVFYDDATSLRGLESMVANAAMDPIALVRAQSRMQALIEALPTS